MSGLSRDTFRPLDDDRHLAQSITDILSTPVGSRVLRRDYGSDLPRLLDAPMNGETMVDIYMAVAEALARWEPRFVLSRVQVESAAAGHAVFRLDGRTAGGETTLSVTGGAAA